MARIVCITSGLTGILHASFELVARLEKAGHQVTYACPQEIGDRVRPQGFEYVQLPPINFFPAPDLPDFDGPLRKVKRMWYKIKHGPQRRSAAVEALGMDAFKNTMRQLSPDLLILDVELHDYIMTAYSESIPLVLLSQWFSLWKRPGLPPLSHDTIPGEGWRGQRLGLELAWLGIKVRRWWMFGKKRLLSAGTDRRSVLQRYASQVGFPLKLANRNYWPGPFTYNTLPVLSMTAWELEFPHSIRPNLHYIGPMVFAGRKEKALDPMAEEKLKTIFERRAKGSALIYCSVSTFREGDKNFLSRLIEAVKDQSDWEMIISLGGLLKEATFDTLPANVHSFSWVPQLRILEQADCSINHGGIHTINECIHFRVPMLIYSGKRSDQNGCAARVAYHGLGIMADKDVDGAEDIQFKINQVLNESSFKERMEEMHRHYQKYQEENRLASVVKKIIPQSTETIHHGI